MWLLLLACAPKNAAVTDPADDETPVLPAPDASLYAHGPSVPRDPMVRAGAEGLPWDEALSGAAGALAVRGTTPQLTEIRWAAIRAGYPYPVITGLMAREENGVTPDDLLAHVHDLVKPGDDLGLARARVGSQDAWVAVVGRPVARLAPFPREVAKGESIELEVKGQGLAPYAWTLVTPTGELRSGALPTTLTLGEEGEWWIEVSGAGRIVASVPVYVGMTTPPQPLVLEGAPVAGPDEAAKVLLDSINRVRSAFHLDPVQRDSTLVTLADWPLEQLVAGAWVRESAEERLQAAGFIGGPVAQLVCAEDTVVSCVDNWLRKPRDRAMVLEPGFRIGGAKVQVRTDGITAVLNLASE